LYDGNKLRAFEEGESPILEVVRQGAEGLWPDRNCGGKFPGFVEHV
jgi:hypothetical protein